jgi:transcriptional regulator
MYVPAHFAQDDPATLHDFIDHHPFGLLISHHDGRPMATHLPFLLDRSHGAHGALRGHVARANPQWRQIVGQEVLAIFNGPHAFISPSWYQAKNVVPTWNYVAVHAYGRVELIEETDALVSLVHDLTAASERGLANPWDFDPADPFVRKLSGGIVGFRMVIDRLEGKWKLNQNHPAERRRRVIDALRQQGGDDSRAIADLMAEILEAGTTGPEGN